METFELDAKSRTEKGKGASRRLRRTGQVPAILYGADKDPVQLAVSHNELTKHIVHEAFYSHILTLNVDGQPEKVVLKDVQRHPYRPFVTHLDFQRVNESQKIHMHVPLHLVNEDKCPGVKIEGGTITRQMIEVEIYCLPKDLPEFIEIDMSTVHLNQIVHLSNLGLPAGVELAAFSHGDISEHDLPVVSVHGKSGSTEVEEGEETE